MFVTKTKTATTILLVALMGGGICVTGSSLMQAGQIAPAPPTLPADKDAKPPEKDVERSVTKMPAEMSPQGFAHDFGKLQKGVQAEYAFVVVNTSTVPLNMSLRYSGCSFPKTARLSDSVLQPGQQATVEIVVDTRRFVGPRSAALYLSAENDRLMVTVFTITADCVDTQGNPF